MTTDFNKLTVVELRAELKKHGLPQAGKKADLIERLSSAVDNAPSEDAGTEAPNVEQAAKSPDPPKAATTTADPAAEISQEPVVTRDEPIADAPKPVDVSFPTGDDDVPEIPNDTDDAQPPGEAITTTTIKIAEDSGSSESAPAMAEVIRDVQSRKRRSRTPSVDAGVRKRLRPDDPEPRHVDSEMADVSQAAEENGVSSHEEQAVEPQQESSELNEGLVRTKGGLVEPTGQLPGRLAPASEDTAGDQDATRSALNSPLLNSGQGYPQGRVAEDAAAEPDFGADERPVVPALHPATSALYIKNFMRPLRTVDVKDHLVALATPPSQEPNPDIVVDFYLDPIRTHAFVNFTSISAASRVRSALHDQIWPDERNRKALWVDFIPPEKVLDWVGREEADGGGRGKMNRWEVVYETDVDGNMTARLEEGGADATRQNPRPPAPPTGPASTFIPTGPAQMNSGVQGAPLGPRGRGGRMAPGYPPQGVGNPQDGFKATRALPSLLYKPASEELAGRRIYNMRSFYTKDQYRDMGAPDEINRYTFENADAFVDRGKEVFVGIRPPHRERDMRRGGGRPSGPRRGGPPPSFHPRGDRYMGGRNGGRDDFTPRSRLDGAPLPTYDSRSDRRGRNGYGGYGRYR